MRYNDKWGMNEEVQLMTLVTLGVKKVVVAELIGRSLDGVRDRLFKLRKRYPGLIKSRPCGGTERIWDDERLIAIYRMRHDGLSARQMAARMKVGRSAVLGAWHRYIKGRENEYAQKVAQGVDRSGQGGHHGGATAQG